ncbi:metalloendopeptidase-like membrane protein [Desulfitobacterium dichloroeliminans LMG P-21439]|uniref:Metalloendopeptidase-like membrane protein n=1 Tax=Desulfitobacterium dichloroeliminans (strain LMG P-21439 / DCA1) TaxID=871963 RepID=L0FCQ0_DESDL|nr:M23 family metallopeptidase [Desulfitobacterium dichloroeliminans]AGA70785.1 metalloendopeptidase-like membrane protein [Desulfitobacterium dichloroeliminans LMG P-21439]
MAKRKGLLALLLTTVLLAGSVIPLQAGELEDAINKQKELQKKEEQARSQLNKLTYTADKLQGQIKDLATQISVAKNTLDSTQVAYNQAAEAVSLSEQELEEREEELANRQIVLRQRVREIYEAGQVSYLEIIFEAEDLSDFITRLEYFNRLVTNDQKILTDISIERAKIEEETKLLQVRRDEAAQLKVAAEQAKATLDGKKREHQVALNSNKKAQEDIFEQIERMEADSNDIADKIRKLTANSDVVHGTISTYPLPGYKEVSSSYGWRIHPITKKKSLHTGTDLPAPTGTKVLAAGNGEVIMASWYGAYGNAVIVDHGGGYTTLYGHNSKLAVKVGDKVKAGDVVSYVGSTGWSTGPHLHFEVRLKGETTDPLQFFR